MKIIRFLDLEGNIRIGTDAGDGSARELRETEAGGYHHTGGQQRIARYLPPVFPPAIFCIGVNYRQHAKEAGLELPRFPVLFMKNPAAAIGHEAPIVLPQSCREKPQADFEAELAVVIGRDAKNVRESRALDYVRGYTIGNDVSARWWQKHAGAAQWIRGKSFDTFCPLGPALVTPDEIPDPDHLALSLSLNGQTMQESSTSDMIFSVSQIITYLSEDTTLSPGTVILTGTPSGVGFVRKPPVYLKPGDRIAITIEKIGTLINTVE